MPDDDKPKFRAAPAPRGLEAAGNSLWRGIAGKFILRADELRVLEDAAREADLIAMMETSRASDSFSMTVKGSQGQEVIHPLISELRQHRSTLASLLRQLKLPDENPEQAAGERSATMRGVAQARWSRRGA